MNKIVRLCGQKELSRLRGGVLAVAFGCLLLGIVQFELAYFAHDYMEVPAYITDVSGEKHLHRSGSRTEYTYTVHYFFNGNEYSARQISGDRPDRDISTAWVAEDNSDVTIYSPHSMDVTALVLMLLGIPAFALWAVLYKRAEPKKASDKEIARDAATYYFFVAVVAAFAVVLLVLVNLPFNENANVPELTLLAFAGLLFASSLTIGIIALKEYKKLEKIEERNMRKPGRMKNYDHMLKK